jgi:hypothetical protein
VGTGILVHILAQTVLFFGLRDYKPQKGEPDESHEPHESNGPDGVNRLGVADGDYRDVDRLSGLGKADEPESAKSKKLKR